ncbi:TPA: AbrB/MazE/SpoVT family DNA-binding domain-containing protein [Candidatus Bathyarchaeota archaeon]|nr:AbrB/MazE/SpoVT family DNA-binding domain-containing protein [Candidatus Bathyarchaeota archaeon]
MGETVIDGRGRVVIPKEIRGKLGLRANQRLLIDIRGDEIVLKPAVSVEEFFAELRGCIRSSRVRPERLKEIWGVGHAHH